ncbi:ALIX V-shaped domain binding to HIV-domain-containing protein [Gilbertella persicaria]|uniref:ALIX V-shaped domain binding to HIV-domain-containing protein n=1 Tax=Gilbertella persicaria TaxID=101096 RepID=UPI0022211E12|nr:ALIX V-shaped domain binding to HIV-domain-containing protein [Gilbertella persicaria]KAI8075378.1 ALIX V-shaped domain binding to HIV-domain-containing protein [Gilbertella persicaria]
MAQAHECIWLKAVMEHMKHGTIARLAFKVADLYDLVSDTKAIPEYWKIYADTKHNYFKAESQYQKANEAISSGRYGEEISRLHLAQSSNNIASQHITQHPHFMIQSFVDRVTALKHAIERDLVRAEKDNDVIYMETVPEPNQLAPILRSDMVKPVLPSFVSDPSYWLVLADRPNDKLFIKRPLFEKLLPFAVHQAVSIYADNKDYIIKTEIIGKNQELKADRQRLLEGLELPYSLDKIDSLPKSLIDHAEEVQDEGGIQSVFDMLQKIQTMSQKASDLINEGFNALEEENEQDAEMSRQFGKLWSRPSSVALTHHLLTLAQKADRIVQAKVNTWGKAISMLSKPVNEIQQHLPSLSENDPSHHGIVQLLSQLRSKVEDLAKESEQQVNLEKNALSLKDDISQSLLKKMDELTKGSPLVKLEPEQFAQNHIQAHVLSQAGLLHSVSELHARLVLMTSDIPLLSKREKAICNLELAFAKFKEIRINLVEGIKFYSQYTDILTQFRDDCVEFALARKLEVTELAKSVAPSRLLLLKK